MEKISENHEQISIFPDRADTYFKGEIIKNAMDKFLKAKDEIEALIKSEQDNEFEADA
jgi:hypothetical protein